MGDAYKRNWAGLHDSPRTAPSARAKFCTYLRWFARPGKMPAEPYFELPISLSKLRRLMQFRLGSHDLPIEQGRMARPIVPRYMQIYICGGALCAPAMLLGMKGEAPFEGNAAPVTASTGFLG